MINDPAGRHGQRCLHAGFKVLQKLRYLNSQIDALNPLETGVGIFPLKVGRQLVLAFSQLDDPGVFQGQNLGTVKDRALTISGYISRSLESKALGSALMGIFSFSPRPAWLSYNSLTACGEDVAAGRYFLQFIL